MTSQRKNSTILINQEAFGTLLLIQNQILGKFNKLMNEDEENEVIRSGYFQNEPMPYAYTFAPFGKKNQKTILEAKQGDKIELIKDGKIVGHIICSSVFKLNNAEASIFRARDISLPSNQRAGEFAISGEFEIYQDSLKERKAYTKRIIENYNIKKITALMLTADPFHRLHERLVRMTIDKADLLIIFLIRTFNGDKRLSFDLRLKTLEFFKDNFLPRDRIIIVPFENTYLFNDHINPVLECIAAHNFGATKLVVGQNHGGIGMFYDESGANTALDKYSKDLNLEVIVMPEFVYCNECRTIVSTKTCPHGQHHHIKYHANTLKELLYQGILPPAILMRKEISAMILSELFPNRFYDLQRIYDDLFPNSGILEKHNQKEFYEQLMNLYQTTSLT
ncbi:ATP-sulfurylase family protein [Campylobacter hyointestinalis]|uniref:sulfate adenylyltransferase n=1 Tax=Campylobacter hyointestinalis TaxID=198 RepID=UPI00072B9F25|nr:sulfate adenylyltransferase [Campylobacter hyointestinalis]PPB56866.1 sulfate adenylyltransferase [Campylobacter hyointestinalis subsp. hyointestinalis]CUU73908.1 ATP-sulfurylase family protein [Campylobacter hyointestinalis]